jgi:S-formylglutathione hydrolase FrmB
MSLLGRLSFAVLAVALTLVMSTLPVTGQQSDFPRGTIERITVHGRALEGNLEGDSPDRPVIVYLPPSYAKETARRYPVLYHLHGYTATAEAYAKVLALPTSIDRAVAAGVREMIVVLPDAFTKYSGSMYSNSPTIGDWARADGAQGRGGGAFANALSAQAAAWAPNPKNPPEFFDLPTKDGEIQPLIAAKWPANSPLVMVDQHVPALKAMRAIALDVGDNDPFVTTNRQLNEALTRLDITNSLEIYDGDHGNRIGERFVSKVLPFFSQHLGSR